MTQLTHEEREAATWEIYVQKGREVLKTEIAEKKTLDNWNNAWKARQTERETKIKKR